MFDSPINLSDNCPPPEWISVPLPSTQAISACPISRLMQSSSLSPVIIFFGFPGFSFSLLLSPLLSHFLELLRREKRKRKKKRKREKETFCNQSRVIANESSSPNFTTFVFNILFWQFSCNSFDNSHWSQERLSLFSQATVVVPTSNFCFLPKFSHRFNLTWRRFNSLCPLGSCGLVWWGPKARSPCVVVALKPPYH